MMAFLSTFRTKASVANIASGRSRTVGGIRLWCFLSDNALAGKKSHKSNRSSFYPARWKGSVPHALPFEVYS